MNAELRLVARCRVCGAPMVSKESLATGIGPKCRGQSKRNGPGAANTETVSTEPTNH
ncbi:DUF6011 domain-containing protein [Paenarthrobacter sp. DKR-5]|uniref:DUF6011 domain-containing protein n=1 Tax=Paenarthrobacter sp. DKR-5 TaxID=2835535 RepID=UPI0035AE8E59